MRPDVPGAPSSRSALSTERLDTERLPYPTDLTDAEWQKIQGVLSRARGGGGEPSRKYPLREVWNAIVYQARTGCSWRLLPHDFPPPDGVWDNFRRWRDGGVIEAVEGALRERVRGPDPPLARGRGREDREPAPPGAGSPVPDEGAETPEPGGLGLGYRGGRPRGPGTAKATVLLEPELRDWGTSQPEGLSRLLRQLLREERERRAAPKGAGREFGGGGE